MKSLTVLNLASVQARLFCRAKIYRRFDSRDDTGQVLQSKILSGTMMVNGSRTEAYRALARPIQHVQIAADKDAAEAQDQEQDGWTRQALEAIGRSAGQVLKMQPGRCQHGNLVHPP
jgi:hypothetical protein